MIEMKDRFVAVICCPMTSRIQLQFGQPCPHWEARREMLRDELMVTEKLMSILAMMQFLDVVISDHTVQWLDFVLC